MTLLLEMSVESSVRNRGGEGESGMMIYKRAKAWEWSVGRDVWSGGRKGRKEKKKGKRRKTDRAKGRAESERRAERKRLGEEGSCPVWKRDKPAPGKTRCECTLRLLVYAL